MYHLISTARLKVARKIVKKLTLLKRDSILQITDIGFSFFRPFFISLYFHFFQHFQTFWCLFVCFSPSFVVFADCTTDYLHLISYRKCFKMVRFSFSISISDFFLFFNLFVYKFNSIQKAAALFIILKISCN